MARQKRQDALAEEHTRDELYDMADELDIPGRSGMNKAELAEAIVLAGGGQDSADTAPAGAPSVPKSMAVSTKEKDYMGRTLITPGVEAKDYMGRLTTATLDHLGRALVDA